MSHGQAEVGPKEFRPWGLSQSARLHALVPYTYLFQKHTRNHEIMFLIKNMFQQKQIIFIKTWKLKMSSSGPQALSKCNGKHILLISNIV